LDGRPGPDRGPRPAARSPVAVDLGASPLRVRAGPPAVSGGGPREPPGRGDPGAGFEREDGRGRAPGEGRGAAPGPRRPVWRYGGAAADPGAGAGPAEDLAGADDRPGRPEAVAGLPDQGRDPESRRDDGPRGHPLADRGLHDLGGGPAPALL